MSDTEELRAAARDALASMDQMLKDGEWYCASERAERLRAALAQQLDDNERPVAWTLRETLDKRETTIRGYLWFTDPKNSSWVPLYAGTKSAG